MCMYSLVRCSPNCSISYYIHNSTCTAHSDSKQWLSWITAARIDNGTVNGRCATTRNVAPAAIDGHSAVDHDVTDATTLAAAAQYQLCPSVVIPAQSKRASAHGYVLKT